MKVQWEVLETDQVALVMDPLHEMVAAAVASYHEDLQAVAYETGSKKVVAEAVDEVGKVPSEVDALTVEV